MQYKFNKEEHLHTLDGKPLTGTSSVGDVLAKPLTWWASGKALEGLGWTNPKLVKREEGIKIAGKARKNFFIKNDEYYDWLQECYKAHSVFKDKKAEEGTDLHAELEHWVKSQMGKLKHKDSYEPKIEPFINWATHNVKKFLWSEAHCYSEKLWIGGISDLGVELNDGRYAVVDFKSSKEAYTSQFIQAGLYAIEIEENGLWDSEGKVNKKLDKEIEALIIIPFGAKEIKPDIKWNISDFKKAGESAVNLYRLINNN